MGHELPRLDRIILFDIRLPRLCLGILVGASLAVSEAVMQGLFRNPLADPGIIRVSAGAGLAAISAIVLGVFLPAAIHKLTGAYLVPIAASFGGRGSTLILYRVATQHGQTSVATMLLAGIALGALAGAPSGILVYLANDNQLRDLTFWGMGSLARATWAIVLAAAPIILLALTVTPLLARGLNGLTLGEAAAEHIAARHDRRDPLYGEGPDEWRGCPGKGALATGGHSRCATPINQYCLSLYRAGNCPAWSCRRAGRSRNRPAAGHSLFAATGARQPVIKPAFLAARPAQSAARHSGAAHPPALGR